MILGIGSGRIPPVIQRKIADILMFEDANVSVALSLIPMTGTIE